MTAKRPTASKAGASGAAFLALVQNPILVATLSVFLGAGGIYLYINQVKPPRNELEKKQALEIQALQASYLESLTTVRALKQERTLKTALEPKLARLAKRIPDQPRLAEMVRDIRESAATAGVQLGEGRPSLTSASVNPLKRLDLEVGASGNFQSLYNFMELLEQTERKYHYTSPSLKLGANRSIETRLTVQGYYLNANLTPLPLDPGDPPPELLTATPLLEIP